VDDRRRRRRRSDTTARDGARSWTEAAPPLAPCQGAQVIVSVSSSQMPSLRVARIRNVFLRFSPYSRT